MNTRVKHIALWTGGVLLLPLLLAGGIAAWAGSEGSLARALQLAGRWLPDDQHLEASDVRGSLAGGGRIGRLTWSKPGLTLTLEGLSLEWSLGQILGRDLQVRALAARRVHARLTPGPDAPDQPFIMPAQVSLPLRLTLPLSILRLEVERLDEAGTSSMQVIEDIVARYRYDGVLHVLRLDSLRSGHSSAQGTAQLDGRTLAMTADLTATLRDLVPDVPFAMQARLSGTGLLAGGKDAALELALEGLQQEGGAAPARVSVKARIHPWRDQPLQVLDLQLQNINTHAFDASAPLTALRGSARVGPRAGGASWDATAGIINDIPGTWNAGRLPLRGFTVAAEIRAGALTLRSARAELGDRAAAGTLGLQGEVPLDNPHAASLQLALAQVDLKALLSTLPVTSITGPASMGPWQKGIRIQADLLNAIAGPLDADRVPFDRLVADARQEESRWRLEKVEARAGTGRVSLQGDFSPRTGIIDVRASLAQLPLRALHRKMAADTATRLGGNVGVAGTLGQSLAFQVDVGSDAPAVSARSRRGQWEIRMLKAQGKWSTSRLLVDQLHLDAFQASADASAVDVSLPKLDGLKGSLQASAPGLEISADAAMTAVGGGGRIVATLASARQLMSWLRGLPIVGGRVPELAASGGASATVDWQGSWRDWAEGIVNPRAHSRLRLDASARSGGLTFDLPAIAGRPATHVDLRSLDVDARGNLLAATLALVGDVRVNDVQVALDTRASAAHFPASQSARGWNITLEKLAALATLPGDPDPWRLQLAENLQFAVQQAPQIELRATAGSATLTAPPGAGTVEPLRVSWQPVLWRRTTRGAMTLQSAGTVSGIQPAWLDVLMARKDEGPIAAAGMRTDLVLSADWDVRMNDQIAIRARLSSDKGDLSLIDPEVRAGIRAFAVTVQANDENVNASLTWDTERAGRITARAATRLERHAEGWSLPPDAPLSGTVDARLQDLSTWAFLAPPGWRIQGELAAGIQLSGSVQVPRLAGTLEGRGLNIRSVLDGVDLHGGTLRAVLRDARLDVQELTFEGGTGSRAYVRGFSGNRTPPPTQRGRMVARGFIDWSRVPDPASADMKAAGSGIVMSLEAELQRMQVLVRHDRQMTLSGKLTSSLDAGVLRVRGDLNVDRASIVLPEAGAPTLGDDVLISRTARLRNAGAAEARQAHGQLETRRPMDVEINLDLGRDLALEGQGITTRLEGELAVRSSTAGSDPFRVFGEVRTVEGRYRAWGQALDVETGVVRFNGPYGNPSLDLLAIRPKIEVRAGVRVTGTLLAPRVQLFSEPDLPEGEKLSWVVLGRATVITGTEGSSMQQAALGLAAGQLGGRLATGLGLDELGLSDSGVSVGKRISNELYLTYQQGLAGAASTLFIFYDITRKLTLRAQASEASAVDLVYTIKFD